MNQSCSSPRELSNASSHSICRRWKEVDSRLLVVGNQTTNLTSGPSFAHNLGCMCPNGSCEANLDIYTSRTFHWYKKNPNARCFDPFCWALKVRESRRTLRPQLWECEFHPHTWPKWGCDKNERKINQNDGHISNEINLNKTFILHALLFVIQLSLKLQLNSSKNICAWINILYIYMCIIPNWVTSTNAPPNSLKDSNANPKVKTMKEEGLGVCSLILNTSGVKRACWSSEMKTKMSD